MDGSISWPGPPSGSDPKDKDKDKDKGKTKGNTKGKIKDTGKTKDKTKDKTKKRSLEQKKLSFNEALEGYMMRARTEAAHLKRLERILIAAKAERKEDYESLLKLGFSHSEVFVETDSVNALMQLQSIAQDIVRDNKASNASDDAFLASRRLSYDLDHSSMLESLKDHLFDVETQLSFPDQPSSPQPLPSSNSPSLLDSPSTSSRGLPSSSSLDQHSPSSLLWSTSQDLPWSSSLGTPQTYKAVSDAYSGFLLSPDQPYYAIPSLPSA